MLQYIVPLSPPLEQFYVPAGFSFMANFSNTGVVENTVRAPPPIFARSFVCLKTTRLGFRISEEPPARWAVVMITYMSRLHIPKKNIFISSLPRLSGARLT